MMENNGRALPGIGERIRSKLEYWMPVGKILAGGNILAGMEITPSSIKTVRVDKRKSGWGLTHWGELPLPPGTVKCSYKERNISDIDSFKDAVWSAVEAIGGDGARIGISLPNETMKVYVQEFDELPRNSAEIRKMVNWWAGKTLRISPEDFVISYQVLGESAEGRRRVLAALGHRAVIHEYEFILNELNILPVMIRPAGINQFNFYSEEIPSTGVFAYLGFFDAYFAFVVIENGTLLFYHGVKKGASDSHFIHNLDMTLQFFLDSCPEKKIERLFMGYPGNHYLALAKDLMEIIAEDIVVIDESRFIALENGNDSAEFPMLTYSGAIGSARCLSFFSAAIGAAQSLNG